MAVNKHVLVLPILFMVFAGCMGELCTTSRELSLFSGYTDKKTECLYGCCGSSPYGQYCCFMHPWLVGAIVGGVIGGIVLISVVIVLICMCLKQQSHQGRVIQPITNPPPVQCHTTMASSSMGGPGQYNMYASNMEPTAAYPYPPPGPPPPAPAYTEPVKQ